MRLEALCQGEAITLPPRVEGGLGVADLTDDSRQVQPGWLFIARSGSKEDGAKYLHDAVNRGAGALLVTNDATLPETITTNPQIMVARYQGTSIDSALCGRLAEKLHDYPSGKLQLVGITGTKGKTTVATLIQQLLSSGANKCGLIGTVCIDDGQMRTAATLTTPGATDFSRLLARMVNHGCRFAVAEYSSHALHQGRVASLATKAGVYTNLSGDHLDYHGTMDNYAAAKAILFESLPTEALAVVNIDDAYAPRMLRDSRARVMGCAMADGANAGKAQATVRMVSMQASGSVFALNGPWGELTCRVPLVGAHNGMNVLQAAVIAHVLAGLSKEQLRLALEACVAPPGRLEPVTLANHDMAGLPTVLVDYAHTFDPLEKTLRSLRPVMKKGARLICLFGCGGDRDRTKRPKMAAVACREADLTLITSDNPRTEDPQSIIDEILTGVPDDTVIGRLQGEPSWGRSTTMDSKVKVLVHSDRALAIRWAIALAQADDVVLLAGKGHETYQIIGTTKHPFDDREQAKIALERWLRS